MSGDPPPQPFLLAREPMHAKSLWQPLPPVALGPHLNPSVPGSTPPYSLLSSHLSVGAIRMPHAITCPPH